VEEFIGLGAKVLAGARKTEDLQQLQAHLPEGMEVLTADVSTAESRQALLNKVHSDWGELDILVNNVGTNIRKPTTDYTEAEYDFVMSTNLRSAFELSRSFYPLLKTSEQGNIIQVTSVA